MNTVLFPDDITMHVNFPGDYMFNQFSSVTQLCLTVCNPMDCSMPGLPVHHQLLQPTHTQVCHIGGAIQPSHPLLSPSPPTFSLSPASGSFPKSQFFTSGGQSIGVSGLASVLPMNIQDWFPLGLTGWNSLLPLPTTQEKTLLMDITRWSILKSDWLYSMQTKMKKLYTVSPNKTRWWPWLRSWAPYWQVQTKMKKVGKTTRPFRYDLNQIPYEYTVEVTNRFKGLDLIDRVPEELWKEVRDIVQEAVIKIIPMERKCKKAKWFSRWEKKKREAKGKGEKER